ncbi:hypothetical protein METP2_03678 [Methanosarcinales archaeon]|nr:hypothetical protein METP2_03678 [Methanosarcinales archaeon]
MIRDEPIFIDANGFHMINMRGSFPLYLETTLKHNAVLVSMDDKDFLMRIKGKGGIKVCHPKDFP